MTSEIENRIRSQPSAQTFISVAELPDFPFETYANFVEAQKEGKTLVWVRVRFPVFWTLASPLDRFQHWILLGLGLWASLFLIAWALYGREYWLLLSLPVALLGLLFATPTPGCVNGCVPTLLCLISFFASVFTRQPVLLVGLAGLFGWFTACAGLGMADILIREAMVQSETVFLWLYANGVLTRVERKQEALENA